MRMYLALAALVAVAVAAPPHSGDSGKDAQILKSEFDNIGTGEYKFSYETSDGVSRSEVAEVEDAGTDHQSLRIRGTVSWTDREGKSFSMNYVADKEGFRPEGEHLPH